MTTTTPLEDRLAAALTARADLVHPEDLTPADPPATVSRLRTAPRAAAYTLVAAAAVAAIVAPIVLLGGPGPSAPEPAPSVPPTPNGDQVPGQDWTVAYRYPEKYDVDGDGSPDELVIRTEGTQELPEGLRRMEVDLSSGGQAAVLLDYETYDLTAIRPVELDGSAGDEVLYYRGTVDDGRDIGVVDLVDGALVDLTVPDDPGLTATATERDGWRARHYWVQDGALYTLRTVDGGFVPGGSNPTRPPYAVDVWQWAIEDGALVAEPQEQQCWKGSGLPRSCTGAGDSTTPSAADEATDWIQSAETFTADADGDGRSDVVALEGPARIPDGEVDEGQVLLVVSLGGGGELSAPVPAGWAPEVLTTPVAFAGGGVLLRQEGGDRTPMTLYLPRDGALVPAAVGSEDTLFGNGFADSAPVRSDTLVTGSGELWTRSADVDGINADEWTFRLWSLDGETLTAGAGVTGCWEC